MATTKALVLNKTARQFNLKAMTKDGRRVVVRLVPGLNSVDPEHFKAFVPGGNNKPDAYVEGLRKKGLITWGKEAEDAELDTEAVESKSKSEKKPAKSAKKDS